MNTTKTIIALIVSFAGLLTAQNGDERPAMNEPPAKLIGLIQIMAAENVAAARVNVAHDVTLKKIRIFSTTNKGKIGHFQKYEYDVEIIYNSDIAAFASGVGSYRFQHNNQIFTFAAAQYASGKKTLGRWLMEILVDAEPELFWENSPHPVIPIKQILAKLDKSDETTREILKGKSRSWNEIIKTYGPEIKKP